MSTTHTRVSVLAEQTGHWDWVLATHIVKQTVKRSRCPLTNLDCAWIEPHNFKPVSKRREEAQHVPNCGIVKVSSMSRIFVLHQQIENMYRRHTGTAVGDRIRALDPITPRQLPATTA